MRLITLTQLRARLGGRSRNAIFRDIEAGMLPSPLKLGADRERSRNYWDEAEVEAAIQRLKLPRTAGW